jgi:hypothetical protein
MRPPSASVAIAFFVTTSALADVSSLTMPLAFVSRGIDGLVTKWCSVALALSVSLSSDRSSVTAASAFFCAAAA